MSVKIQDAGLKPDPRVLINELWAIDHLSGYTWFDVEPRTGIAVPVQGGLYSPSTKAVSSFRAVADAVFAYACHGVDGVSSLALGHASSACRRQALSFTAFRKSIEYTTDQGQKIALISAFAAANKAVKTLSLKDPAEFLPQRGDIMDWIMPVSRARERRGLVHHQG